MVNPALKCPSVSDSVRTSTPLFRDMQAFNSSKNQRIIDKKLDTFRSRKPIDIIAKTNPILIIDEPQSVEGKQTKESLKKFQPLFTLRYSATHKEKYDMVYRLDALNAYNQHLVKKIAALGVTLEGSTATNGYVYCEGIDLYKDTQFVLTQDRLPWLGLKAVETPSTSCESCQALSALFPIAGARAANTA